MSEERTAGEQSMDDILASIRRIILDEGDGPIDTVRSGADDPAMAANAGSESVKSTAPASKAPVREGAQSGEDLSDFVEAGRPTEAGNGPVSSVGKSPKALVGRSSSGPEKSLADGDEKSTSTRIERPTSLTERLALRERMAALDLKGRAREAAAKSDGEPSGGREVAPEARAGKSFSAIEPGGPTGNLEAARPVDDATADLGTSGSAPAKPVAEVVANDPPQASATAARAPWTTDRANEAGASAQSDAKDVSARREVEGPKAPVSEREVGLTPRTLMVEAPQTLPKTQVKTAATAGPGVSGRQSGEAGGSGVKRVEPGAALRSPETGPVGVAIPSIEAVGVAALNKAGAVAEDDARGAKVEPSAELVESARETLHDDEQAENRALTSARSGSSAVTLEDVVREALRPVLKSWLDENLPKTIEKLVREEVRRALAGNKRDLAD